MEQKEFYLMTGKGAFRAAVITVILLVLLSVVMSFTDISGRVVSVTFLLITCISIIYGAIYAAKKNNRKGWLTGLAVSLTYMLILYIISGLFFGDYSINTKDLTRLAIAVLVGVLSGMLGINI